MLRNPARKRVLFREVNERIRDVSVSFGLTSSYEILCECASTDCALRVPVPGLVHAEAVADGQRFVVAPGHERPSDWVGGRGETYAVIAQSAA
jgi:hypothetical protein